MPAGPIIFIGWDSCFRSLFNWKRSFYRLIAVDFFVFLGLYTALSLIHHFALDDEQRQAFSNFSQIITGSKYSSAFEFVLGIFINVIIHRYFRMYKTLPWPDDLALKLEVFVRDDADDSRRDMLENVEQKKETPSAKDFRIMIYRYYCIGYILALNRFSCPVAKRFPTFESLLGANEHVKRWHLITKEEVAILKRLKDETLQYESYAFFARPFIWALQSISRAREAGYIEYDSTVAMLKAEIDKAVNTLTSIYDAYAMPQVLSCSVQVVEIGCYVFLGLMAFRMATLVDFLDVLDDQQHVKPKDMIYSFGLREGNDTMATTTQASTTIDSIDIDESFGMLMAIKVLIFIFVCLQNALYLAIVHTSMVLLWPFGGNQTSIRVNDIINRHLDFYLGFLRNDYCLEYRDEDIFGHVNRQLEPEAVMVGHRNGANPYRLKAVKSPTTRSRALKTNAKNIANPYRLNVTGSNVPAKALKIRHQPGNEHSATVAGMPNSKKTDEHGKDLARFNAP